jgi:hypothetical protein
MALRRGCPLERAAGDLKEFVVAIFGDQLQHRLAA